MSFLKRLFGGKTLNNNLSIASIPNDMEQLFTPPDLNAFYNLINDYFTEQGNPYNIQNGFVIFQKDNESIDLRKIAQICNQSEQSEWKEIINKYFEQLSKIKSEVINDFCKITFSDVANFLAIKLWPAGSLKMIGRDNLIYREDLEGTISVLVLDLPDAIQAVNPKMIASWGKSNIELFKIGLENVRAHCKPENVEVVLAGDVKTIMLSKDEDIFNSTHVLFLKDYPSCIGTYGSIVAIPLSDNVICYPINDAQIGRAIHVLMPTVNDVFRQGPGSISPYLYWYMDGKFSTLHYIKKGNKIQLPQGLMDIVNMLSNN